MSEASSNLEGTWHSYYRYPSTGRGEFWCQHVLEATIDGNILRMQSVASTPEPDSEVTLELSIDASGLAANGTWRERTSPTGHYRGTVYEGTVEFTIAKEGTRLNGRWFGTGKDGETNSDVWDLTREAVEVGPDA